MESVIGAVLRGETVTAEELAAAAVGEVAALATCPQTPEFHAEGNVAVHTAMVLDEAYRRRGGSEWGAVTLRLGALLHDIGKPATTQPAGDGTDPGRWSSHGHAEEGARIVNELFDTVYELQGLPLGVEVAVHTLVRNHMWTYGIEKVSPGAMLRSSHLAHPALLQELWAADGAGRICNDPEDVAYRVELAGVHLEDNDAHRPDSMGVLEEAEELLGGVSARARRESFRALVEGRISGLGAAQAHLAERERRGGRGGSLTYTMGLPGIGKSTWAQTWETETGGVALSTTGRRRRDRAAARRHQIAEASRLLKEGRDVCVDATNLRREGRDLLLAAAERAAVPVRGVWFRGGIQLALQRQRTRPWEDAVPGEVIRQMRRDARFPSADEYDTLDVVEVDGTTWSWTSTSRWERHSRSTR